MLRIYLITVIILCSISVFGQKRNCKDYEINNSLNESFKNIEKNNIEKGIELLSKVQNCKNLKNYNSYSLFSNFIEALIFNKQEDYDNALKTLNSMEEGFLHKSKDSLVVETLFLKFGKEKVLNSFRNISRIESNPNKANVYSVYLNEIDYQFNFNSNEGGWCKYDDNGDKISIYKPTEIINEKLDRVARCTGFYIIPKK